MFDCSKTRSFEELESGMINGEKSALVEFVTCRKNFDGANLGDLYRAAGLFTVVNPEEYLGILNQQQVSQREMPNFLIMLPLETVDNFDNKKAVLRERLTRINSVKPSPTKNTALNILEERLKQLSVLENEQ